MAEGMMIEGDEAPRRGPGRPPLRQKETLRPDTRSESLREAEEYARQIMEEGLSDSYSFDEFHIDKADIPDGWEYQWKRTEVLGKEDRAHQLEVAKNKWRPVDASRHPEKMPPGHVGPIIIKGLMLCEIPKSIADTRRRMENREAVDVLKNSESMLYETPPNTAPRDDPSLSRAGINKVSKDFRAPAGSHAE